MLAGPVSAYILGILLALPVYVLILGLGFVLLRLVWQWLFDDGSAPGPRIPHGPWAKSKAKLKG